MYRVSGGRARRARLANPSPLLKNAEADVKTKPLFLAPLAALSLSFLAHGPVSAGGNILLQKLADHPMPITKMSENGRWKGNVIPANPNRGAPAQAVLYAVSGGEETVLWMTSLSNPVMPEDVRVSNAGYVVTLDNWGEPGSGKETVAIFSPDGARVKAFALADLFGKKEIEERISRPLFDRHWREDSTDYLSADGKTWTLRTVWGKVLTFRLETGSLVSGMEDTYVLRHGAAGSLLYRVSVSGGTGGTTALVPCLGIDAATDTLFSIRSSTRETGGMGRLAVDGRAATLLKTRFIEATQEREDLFRAAARGTTTITLANPKTKLSAAIGVQIR